MNSNGIEPRVGMQVYAFNGRDRITKINMNKQCAIKTQFGREWYHPSQKATCYWNEGKIEIEWIPPTDEERKFFQDIGNRSVPWYGPIVHYDVWYTEESGHWGCGERRSIAESLALDGADYDNMPEGYV